jgi:hypothetical protein
VKKGEQASLSPRERCFVELVANPLDTRSIGAKAQAAGWSDGRYGYKVQQREHVADAIDRATGSHVRVLRARAARVLSVLADRAESGDVKAAALFLEAMGFVGGRGVNVVNTVSASRVEVSLEDDLEARIIVAREQRGLAR